jgi:hypothetical protein
MPVTQTKKNSTEDNSRSQIESYATTHQRRSKYQSTKRFLALPVRFRKDYRATMLRVVP